MCWVVCELLQDSVVFSDCPQPTPLALSLRRHSSSQTEPISSLYSLYIACHQQVSRPASRWLVELPDVFGGPPTTGGKWNSHVPSALVRTQRSQGHTPSHGQSQPAQDADLERARYVTSTQPSQLLQQGGGRDREGSVGGDLVAPSALAVDPAPSPV